VAERLLKSPINEETSDLYAQYIELLGELHSPDAVRTITRNEVCSIFNRGKTNNRIVLGLRRYLEVVKSRVRQLLSLDIETETSRDMEFRGSPRTRLKLLQELCSRPSMRQSFSREDLAKHGEAWGIRRCIIDPDLIDDHLLACLGLDEFIPSAVEQCFPSPRKAIPMEDQIAVKAEAVPSVKDMFANGLEPLLLQDQELELPKDVRYFRLFRITKGKNRGKILGTYNTPDHKKEVFLSDDINSAYRRIDHILEGYDEEIRILGTIDRNVRAVRDKYANDWNSVKEHEEIPALIAKIEAIADTLSPHVKDEHKKQIRSQVRECLSVLDSLGRKNPNAKAARLSTALSRIGSRLSAISRISQHLINDRVHVDRYRQEERRLVLDFCDKVESHGDKLIVVDTDHEIKDANRSFILANLREARDTFKRFKFQPYLALAEDMTRDLDIIIDCIENNKESPEDRVARQQAFLRVYTIAKIIKLEHMIGSIKNRFFKQTANLEDINTGPLFSEIKKLHEYFAPKKRAVKRDVRVEPLPEGQAAITDSYPLYVAMHAEIRELLRLGAQACSSELQTDERSADRVKLLVEIDKRLKNFSISKLMEDIRQ